MKILLVYPKYPDTFWSFKHALKFISKKAAFPPLGLLTVAAMLPKKWEKKLVDMNVSDLKDKDIAWADYVFIGAMITQKESVKEVIKRCKDLGVTIVAGGPLFTTGSEEFEDVDHFVLNEAEITLPRFLEDLQKGCAKKKYTTNEYADITQTPIPLWNLIDVKKYASMAVQYCRGCPFDCEFCDIVIMSGHKPRTKNKEQLLRELDAIYQTGFDGAVFVVDDNFIGNKIKLKEETLPAIISWQEEKNYPFALNTQASINLSDDDGLIDLMTQAGFGAVFIGIETPSEEGLAECGKTQNTNRNLVAAIKKLQNNGLQVQAGFIVGFDSDTPAIFDRQISFIQESGIVTAMVGMLNVLPGTKLFQRLKNEKRLLMVASGNNTDASINFVPKMNPEILMDGYKKINRTIFSPKETYDRIVVFLKEYKPVKRQRKIKLIYIKAFLKSIWHMGITGKRGSKRYYWKVLIVAALKHSQSFPEAVAQLIWGYHFRKIAESIEKAR